MCLYKLFNINPLINDNQDLNFLNSNLEKLNVNCFVHRFIIRLSNFIYSIINNSNAPEELKSKLMYNYQQLRPYKPRNDKDLTVPSISKLNDYGEKTFAYFYPKFINDVIPNEIEECEMNNQNNLNQKDCVICLNKVSIDNYTIKDCNHKFCKICLVQYLENVDNSQKIECPFRNNSIDCKALITTSDLENILDKEKYEKFHSEKIINDKFSDKIKDLEDLLDSGAIIRCPKCLILIEKYDGGCQFVRCFYCKLDICWLTRQPRWGPGGKGDTTGGCQCGLNGLKCHPN
ncbi:unnamed protein product, partial [Brachionus calyciflorus]